VESFPTKVVAMCHFPSGDEGSSSGLGVENVSWAKGGKNLRTKFNKGEDG